MEKLKSIVFILISVIVIFVGYSYFKKHQERETYKAALVKDLEQAYRRITLEELDRAKKMNKNIQHFFDTACQESNIKKNTYKNAIDYIIAERHHNINLDLETLDDANWNAAQQSGVLLQFSKDELVLLNKVYNVNKTLIVAKERVKNLTLEPFPFSTKDEINTISNAYLTILLELERTLYHLGNAAKNAVKKLNPDNKPIKKIDSLFYEK